MDGTQPSIDLVFALVDSLSAASDRFRELGFTVGEGGLDIGSGSECAIVAFRDGSLLQLVERPRGLRVRRRRRRLLTQRGARRARRRGTPAMLRRTVINCERLKPGLMDFALRSSAGAMSEAFESLSCRRRFRAPVTDASNEPPPRRPITDAELRVPNDRPRTVPIVRSASAPLAVIDRLRDHRNEIQGIFRVEVGVCGMEEACSAYEELTGVTPEIYENAFEERRVFRLRSSDIELVRVETAFEEGVREIGLRAGFRGHHAVFDPNRCHGIEMHVQYVEPHRTPDHTADNVQSAPDSTAERNEHASESTSSGIP